MAVDEGINRRDIDREISVSKKCRSDDKASAANEYGGAKEYFSDHV